MTLKLKRFAIAILCSLLTLSMVLSIAFYSNSKKMTVSATVIEKDDIIAESSYLINHRETFPATTSVEYNDSQVVAEKGVIVFPNGATYSVGNGQQFVLDTVGTYTLKYFYEDAVYTDQFLVSDKLYSLSDDGAGNSISEYIKDGEPSTYDPDIYRNFNSNVTVAAGTYVWDEEQKKEVGGGSFRAQYKRSEYTDGLIVKMKENVKFNYAEPINLNDVSEDGISNIMSFSLMTIDFYDDYGYHYTQSAHATGVRKNVVQTAYVTLTDAYDPTKYVQVVMSWESENLYARVSTNEMSSKGLSVGSLGSINTDYKEEVYYGSRRSMVQTDHYGVDCGVKPNLKGFSSKIHLRYDNEKGIMYWGAEKNKDIKGGTTALSDIKNINQNLIMDLKNPAVTGGTVFSGFTTGEVYLSVHFEDALINDSARIDIYSIGNKNAKQIINSNDVYEDINAPVLQTEFKSTYNDGVYANVGTDFIIPSAKATDINLNGDVSVAVYRNYGTAASTAVPVKDGKIAIDSKDVYSIVYTAKDSYGNESKLVRKVYGVDANTPVISFDKSERFDDKIKIMEGQAFPLKNKISTINNYDDLKLKIEFISDKETFVFADLKNGQEIDAFWAEEPQFATTYAGDFTVRFTYSDNAVNGVWEEQFTAISNPDKVTFSDKPFIPRLLLKDAVYDLTTVDAFGYATGEPKLLGKAQLQIKFDNGSFEPISDIRKVKIEGNSTAQLKAVYNGSEILSDVAVIKDVNYGNAANKPTQNLLDITKYFHYEGNDFRLNEQAPYDLFFVSNNAETAKTLQFANMVPLKDFKIYYKILKAYSGFDKLSFVLTDPYNTDNVLEISMYNKSGSVYYSYNGVEVKSTEQFGSDMQKNISYRAQNGLLTISGVSQTCFPEVNFTMPLAYLDIVFEGVRGETGIQIVSMNGQSLYRNMRDTVKPELLTFLPTGQYGVGQVITLPAIQFADLLSVVEHDVVSSQFLFNNTQPQVSTDGVALNGVINKPDRDYQVRLNSFGSYYYRYNVTDAFGNKNNHFLIIDPMDKTAPTITFTGSIKADDTIYVELGDTLELQYVVADNSTPVDKLTTTIVMRDYRNAILYALNSKTVTFDKLGRFQISIACQDQANNLTIKSFDVIVLEEIVEDGGETGGNS